MTDSHIKKKKKKNPQDFIFRSVIVADLQSAPGIVFPWAKERRHRLLEARVKHVKSLHGDGVVETQKPVVIVQIHAHPGWGPVVCHGDTAILRVGVEAVLQADAPVSCGWGQADVAFPVAADGGDPQVPHSFVPHVHLPVVLTAGVLGDAQDAAEAREALGHVSLVATDAALLHFGVEVRDVQVRVSCGRVQRQVLRH